MSKENKAVRPRAEEPKNAKALGGQANPAANDNAPLRFLSVCSGIEAASVAWPNWQAVAFAEIEKFPSAVLAHHYPDVPNLGDMTKFKEWPDMDIDVLSGGTPCQSFSVAGLREGLKDPRGNLTLTFLGIAKKYNPEWIIWENVPGIISDKTGALESFMGGLNDLGYAIESDILDAQHFGLAQRRRRIILVCYNIEIGRKKRTQSFVIATLSFLTQSLLCALSGQLKPSEIGANVSDWPATYCARSLPTKMKLFGMPQERRSDGTTTTIQSFMDLLKDLDEACQLLAPEPNKLESISEKSSAAGGTLEERSRIGSAVSKAGYQYMSTLPLWSSIWADLCQMANASTTSTATKTTTTSQIYIFAEAALSIVEYTTNLMTLPAHCLDEDSSGLTALRGFTNYARQANSDLFARVDGVCDWGDFAQRAEKVICAAERYLGERAHSGSFFSIPKSLHGNPAPSRKAGEDIAPTISARTKGGGGLGTDFDLDGGLVQAAAYAIQERAVSENLAAGPQGKGYQPDVAYTLEARNKVQSVAYAPEIARCVATREGSSQDYESTTMVAVGITGDTSHRLTAEGADASEDGTGRGTTIVVHGTQDPCTSDIAFAQQGNVGPENVICFTAKDYGADATVEQSPTLRAGGYNKSHANAGVEPAVTVALRGRDGGATAELGGEVAGAQRASQGGGDKPHVLAFNENQQDAVWESQTTQALNKGGGKPGQGYAAVRVDSAVRRLTPTECERLMGFPDSYTQIPWRNKPADQCPDGPRYKALGNSWAVPKFAWLGARIQRLMPANDNNKDSHAKAI